MKKKVIIKETKLNIKNCNESFNNQHKYRLYYSGDVKCFLCKKIKNK